MTLSISVRVSAGGGQYVSPHRSGQEVEEDQEEMQLQLQRQAGEEQVFHRTGNSSSRHQYMYSLSSLRTWRASRGRWGRGGGGGRRGRRSTSRWAAGTPASSTDWRKRLLSGTRIWRRGGPQTTCLCWFLLSPSSTTPSRGWGRWTGSWASEMLVRATCLWWPLPSPVTVSRAPWWSVRPLLVRLLVSLQQQQEDERGLRGPVLVPVHQQVTAMTPTPPSTVSTMTRTRDMTGSVQRRASTPPGPPTPAQWWVRTVEARPSHWLTTQPTSRTPSPTRSTPGPESDPDLLLYTRSTRTTLTSNGTTHSTGPCRPGPS